jgi:hypothetical protein
VFLSAIEWNAVEVTDGKMAIFGALRRVSVLDQTMKTDTTNVQNDRDGQNM